MKNKRKKQIIGKQGIQHYNKERIEMDFIYLFIFILNTKAVHHVLVSGIMSICQHKLY